MATRGIRTNNPGNLRAVVGGEWWHGQTGVDEWGMCVFASPAAGFRALCLTIVAYQTKHGCDTIRKILYRFAPPDKGGDNNDTTAYIADVCKKIGVAPDDIMNFVEDPERMTELAEAICTHENGSQPWPPEMVASVVASALA